VEGVRGTEAKGVRRTELKEDAVVLTICQYAAEEGFEGDSRCSVDFVSVSC